jgi:hypothetical protein
MRWPSRRRYPVTAVLVCACRLSIDLDPASGVDAPLDRAELIGELVVIWIDVDLALLEALAQCPVVLRSGVDEALFVDRCLATVLRNIRRFELGQAVHYSPNRHREHPQLPVPRSSFGLRHRCPARLWQRGLPSSSCRPCDVLGTRMQPPSRRMITVSSSPKRAMSTTLVIM